MSERININNPVPKTPKFIYYKSNGYQVSISIKGSMSTHHVGRFTSLQEAINARDNFIVSNADGLTKDVSPRGVSFVKSTQKFMAYFDAHKTVRYNLGSFNTLKEAVDYREYFINSLK